MSSKRGPGRSAIRVVVVDDHAVLRTGLCMLIDSQPDMQVVGQAGDASGAISVTRSERPDVLLLDLNLPDSRGGDTVRTLLRECPGARVLVLTMHDDSSHVHAAMEAGARGYISKRAVDTKLVSGLRAIASGRKFVDVQAPEALDSRRIPTGAHSEQDESGRITSASAQAPQRKRTALSARESQVLLLLAHGRTNREIAGEIGVGVKTVETYRARLGLKLGLQTRADIVDYALRIGLLRDTPDT